MDQKGWTDFGLVNLSPAEKIKDRILCGARYLIINNPELYKEEYLKPFIKNKIGSYKNIDIYDLSLIK
jgi:hypothetical protein